MWGSGILKGLQITFKNMLRGPITVKYPYEKLEIPERARWAITHLRDEEGDLKCTACGICVRTCPNDCIVMKVTTAEDKTKTIDLYEWDMGACMFCGFCEEACPFDAIELGHEYELATCDRDALFRTLVSEEPAARPKKRSAESGSTSSKGGESA